MASYFSNGTMWCYRVFFVLVIVILGVELKNPLLDEEIRSRNKAAECVFGNQIKELGSSWVPDLGVPIGVLYCMKCECVQFHRKRRIIAKVQCRSIKNKCPEPTCEDPVLLPGKCCKTCEGTNNTFEVPIQDIVQPNRDEEKITKHFAALLTGRSSVELKNDDMKPIPPNENKNNVVATGRFTLQRKNLYYSFYISDKAARPRSLQFLDKTGNILEEHILTGVGASLISDYQLNTRKICGIWRRLPRDYRRMVREETMYVVLIWGVKDEAEFTLSGQIINNVALGTELFSSLLEPAPGSDGILMAGAGGTAIVSTSSAVSPGIHIAIIFNGVFNIGMDLAKVPLNVTLAVEERKQIVLKEIVTITKPAYDLNVLQFSSPLSIVELRHLTRGRLLLSVASVSKPQALKLSGSVITKTTCEIFQTTLSSTSSTSTSSGTSLATSFSGNQPAASGLAWLYLNNEGALVYRINVEGLQRLTPDLPTQITLYDVSGNKRAKGIELEDLTPYFSDGWANGTVEKVPLKVLDPLYSGHLAVNVATPTDNALLRGKLTARLVDEPRNSLAPYLMKREQITPLTAAAVGMVWLNVDGSCHLHYDISLSGLSSTIMSQVELILEMFPILLPGAPNITLLLAQASDFQNGNSEGSPTETLAKEELRRLDLGFSFLKLRHENSRKILLTTRVNSIRIPENCLQTDAPDNTLPFAYKPPKISPEPFIVSYEQKCLYEGRFYSEDAQWTSSLDPCTMCYCQNGQVKCDTTVCPAALQCGSGESMVKSPDECCAVCQPTQQARTSSANFGSATRVCTFGGKSYSVGSKFHPFLIPNGFDLCTECTCNSTTIEVDCKRVNKRSCCSNTNTNCNEDGGALQTPHQDAPYHQMMNGIPTEISTNANEIMAQGGCKNLHNTSNPHRNGSTYNPIIDSLGEYKCISCTCRDGTQSCQRLQCTHELCNEIAKAQKNTNRQTKPCCSLKLCKRLRRHHRGGNHS